MKLFCQCQSLHHLSNPSVLSYTYLLYLVCGMEFSQSIMHVHVGNQIQQHILQEITIDYLLK